jgi:hypothetical protein
VVIYLKEKPKVKVENNILFFETKSMKLELKDKINLNGFVEFFLTIFAEIVIAKYRLKNREVSKKIRDLVRMN